MFHLYAISWGFFQLWDPYMDLLNLKYGYYLEVKIVISIFTLKLFVNNLIKRLIGEMCIK